MVKLKKRLGIAVVSLLLGSTDIILGLHNVGMANANRGVGGVCVLILGIIRGHSFFITLSQLWWVIAISFFIWGVLLVVIGILNLVIRSRKMFLTNSICFIFCVVLSAYLSPSVSGPMARINFAVFFILGVYSVFLYIRHRGKEGQMKRNRYILIGELFLALVLIGLVLNFVPSLFHSTTKYKAPLSQEQRKLNSDIAVANAYFDRGKSFYENGDLNMAIEQYDHVIELNPDFANAYFNRGIVYRDKGDYDRAILDFDKVIQLKPDDAAGYYSRGLLYWHKGDLDLAIQSYDRAIELNPRFAAAHINRAVVYSKKGDYYSAIQDYNRAIKLQPDDSKAYYGRSTAYRDKGDLDRAIQDFYKAEQLNSGMAR